MIKFLSNIAHRWYQGGMWGKTKPVGLKLDTKDGKTSLALSQGEMVGSWHQVDIQQLEWHENQGTEAKAGLLPVHPGGVALTRT